MYVYIYITIYYEQNVDQYVDESNLRILSLQPNSPQPQPVSCLALCDFRISGLHEPVVA